MSKVSKTARASMGSGLVIKEKKVIPDEVYIKNLRIDLDSGLYVAQEGARALLRAYDAALITIGELNEQNNGLHSQLNDFINSNKALDAELKAALSQIETLTKELDAERTSTLILANTDAPVEAVEGTVDWELKKEGDFIG